MKINKTLTALIAGASIGMSGQVLAVGTEAGTEIKNVVTLSYDVGTTPQSDVTESAQFLVDNKIDMSLTWDTANLKSVAPGATVFHKFTLTNTGNLDQPYDLSAAEAAVSATIIDLADPGIDTLVSKAALVSPTITFYDALTEPTVGDGTTTTLSAVPHSDTGSANQKVFWAGVSYPLTAGVIDTDILGNYVIVTADVSGNGNASDTDKNTAANLEKQLAVNADGAGPNDSANDAKISAIFGDEITTANFEGGANGLKLSVTVVNDPICNEDDSNYGSATFHASSGTATTGVMNCVANAGTGFTPPSGYTPKAIPGALLEYTITATNSGQSSAKDVEFAQDLSTLDFSDVSGVTLRAASLGNVAAAMTGNTDTPVTTGSTTAGLSVTVATFEANADISITFTAIVD